MGLQEEVWPFSPYFLKGNWRAKLAETRLTVPPPEKHTRTNSRVDPDGEIERHDARVLGTAQHQDVRRLWLRRRGSLANSWKRRRSGGGRGGGSGASAKPRHSSVHVRRRVLLTSELPGGGNEGSGAFTNVGKRPFSRRRFQGLSEKNRKSPRNEKYSNETQMFLCLSRGDKVSVELDHIRPFSTDTSRFRCFQMRETS